MKVSIVIPARNEAGRIVGVLEDIYRYRKAFEPFEIIVVDDGSTDETALRASFALPGSVVRVISERLPRGRGAAIASGILESRGEIIVIHDADGEIPASPLPAFVSLIEGGAMAVHGVRRADGPGERPLLGSLLNGIATGTFNLLFGTSLSDVLTGACAYRAGLIRSVGITESGFTSDIEILSRILSMGISPIEIDVPYRPRTRAEGKKIRLISDGFAILSAILKYRLAAA